MATKVYPSAVNRSLTSGMNLLSGTVTAHLVAASANYNAAHTVIGDVPAGDREAAVVLTGKSVTNGVFTASAATWSTATGDAVGSIVIDCDGNLVAWLEDFGAGDGATTLSLNGSDITANWSPTNGIVKAAG